MEEPITLRDVAIRTLTRQVEAQQIHAIGGSMDDMDLACVIKDAIDEDPNLDWVNYHQRRAESLDGHVYIAVDGLIDCTLIAAAVSAALAGHR